MFNQSIKRVEALPSVS